MTSVEVWLAILGMTVVTAVTRAMFLIGGERTVLPARVQRMLRYAPAAALAGLGWFLWRRTMLGTIVVGMIVFTVLRLLM